MKKLELKEKPAPKINKLTKAHQVLNSAKDELKRFIKMEAALLYKAIYGNDPDFEEEGGWAICTGDLCGDLYINVEVDNSYLDVEDICYERREMSEVLVLLDDTVVLIDENGEEVNDREITIEELAHVSDLLELTYRNKVNG